MLAAEVASEFWQHIRVFRIAPPSERPAALDLAGRHVAGMVAAGKMTKREAVDRLREIALTDGLIVDEEDFQALMAECFENPILESSENEFAQANGFQAAVQANGHAASNSHQRS